MDTAVALVHANLHDNRHAPINDTALGVLTSTEKWGVDSERRQELRIDHRSIHGGV